MAVQSQYFFTLYAAGSYDVLLELHETCPPFAKCTLIIFGVANTTTPLVATLVTDPSASPSTQADSLIRVIHASPNSLNLDVRVNDVLIESEISYQSIQPYGELHEDTYRFAVVFATPNIIRVHLAKGGHVSCSSNSTS